MKRLKQLFYCALATLMFTGCQSYKKVPYLQDAEVVLYNTRDAELYDAKIMPKDLLTIVVSCTSPELAAPFNLTVATQNNAALSYTTTQPVLQQYLVDNDGNINFPVLGELHVGGLTKKATEQMIVEKLKPYITETPIVTVRMVNYKISVIGEVARPGTFTISNEKVNILEALAMAGDMTVYGLRDDVKLIRENANGKQEIIPLDLNKAETILSPYYYLQQNDIIYVTPNKAKARNSDIGTSTSLWFSATSILVSIASMKEENQNGKERQMAEEQIDFRTLLFKYIIHWPWFVGAVLLCLVGAWFYLHWATPIYNISATVLIKDEKKGGGSGVSSELEDMGLSGLMTSSKNIDNELEVLRSKTLVKEVVNQLNLYITYKDEDEFPAKSLYKTSPVQVSLTPQEAETLSSPMVVEMILQPKGSIDVNVTVGEKGYQKHFEKLPAIFPTDEGTLAFFQDVDSVTLQDGTKAPRLEKNVRHITATINKPMRVAKGYCSSLSIAPTSKTTSVTVISLKNSSLQCGQDFINQLLEMYNRNTNNDKNEIAQKTAEFIDERISIISKELGSTEADLETFKRDAGITDLTSEAQIALAGNAEYEKKSVENRTQISLVNDLRKYLRGNEYEVLPSNVGLQDAALIGAIERYNEMLVERKRLLRTSTENNPAIVNLDTSIRAMKANVQATLEGTLQGLMITKSNLDREASRYSRRISNAPGQERAYVSIARQQEIKAGLYLMLLQKREENAIALAATANNAKIIDEAIADDTPVSPKRSMIYLIALVLGVGIPVGIIYLIELTKFKIEGRADVEKLTSVPIIGDIPLTDEKNDKNGSIAVFENKNNLMSETFRNIRTNLQFMLDNDQKVILVTSTVSGEGKSFVSANLAISLSLLGKKVVIVGLDIRKPGLNKVFHLSNKEKGITQYLSNPETDLMELVQPSDINKNLFILPGGAVPPNPTELLARNGLDKAIEILKQNFDYVIMDTAPIGMVTDTLLVGRVADLSVYVCRADYTHKAEYTLINELAIEKKLSKLCTVINGVDLKKRKYGYYYGYGKYGKYYGYGKRYGYGYGYGEK